MKPIKKIFTSIPGVRYVVKIPIYVFLLPRKIIAIHHAIDRDYSAISRLTDKTTQTNVQVLRLIEKLDALESQQSSYAQIIADLRHFIESGPKPIAAKVQSKKKDSTFADDHMLDDF